MSQPASPIAPLEHSSKLGLGSYRWVVLGATTLAQTTVSVLTQGLAPVAPFIQANYSLSRAQLGLLSLAVGSGGYLTLMLVGRLIDQLGERWIMLASGVIAGIFAVALIGS
ncbi:MAG: hypothetical protein KGJ86_21330, partial [Chloroflexota bacterium]|nr:hypothetical protein [Chloroflexota bacterium]